METGHHYPPRPELKSSPGAIVSMFKATGYSIIPNIYLTMAYFAQVGADGLAFIQMLIKAYDNALHQHKVHDGWFAISDDDLRLWWGARTTKPIRRARRKVLAATPAFLADCRPG